MVKDVQLSGPTLRVLKHFLDAPSKSWSGGEIRNAIKIGAGTLYPLLARLEAAGGARVSGKGLNLRRRAVREGVSTN